jgi:glucose/arabinose dehydrogenase
MHTFSRLLARARFRPRLERLETRVVPVNPALVDPDLAVRTAVSGLSQPTSMAFIDRDEFFVLEKASGKVQHVVDGEIQGAALDLAVNSASERGLLGIALHPNFRRNGFVYLYWTETISGADSTQLADTPVLGNRVDRFVWDGETLTMDRNIIRLRALQEDAGQPARGNHDGGVIRFGPDGKLYIYIGDVGRRGQMQNLPDGPGSLTAPAAGAIPAGNVDDDQFGGPEPDDEHLTGVILRLNSDGSTPRDNPFFRAGPLMYGEGTEAAANLQKVFAYGIRNGFGMAFDPISGRLWEAQNGDDSFSEINQVNAGANLGWIQVMGPLERINQFKEIETSAQFNGLQQVRWPPANIADSAREVLERLFDVVEGGQRFEAELDGDHEVPVRDTPASGEAEFRIDRDGNLRFRLAVEDIDNVVAAHIHLGAAGQNGPVVADLFIAPSGTSVDVGRRRVIAEGVISDAIVRDLPGFGGTVEDLILRMRQGRTYVNVHTNDGTPPPNQGPGDFPGGEIRGEIVVTDERPVSHYSDPEFSWKFEVAPGALGFIDGRGLGREYRGDMITGAARPFLEGGQLFHFDLSGNRRRVDVDDRRLRDRVADNLAKFEITESESLLFGTGFGVATDIQTGPNGNLFVVSNTDNVVYEIFRDEDDRDDDDDYDDGRDDDDRDDDDDDDRDDDNDRDDDRRGKRGGHGPSASNFQAAPGAVFMLFPDPTGPAPAAAQPSAVTSDDTTDTTFTTGLAVAAPVGLGEELNQPSLPSWLRDLADEDEDSPGGDGSLGDELFGVLL